MAGGGESSSSTSFRLAPSGMLPGCVPEVEVAEDDEVDVEEEDDDEEDDDDEEEEEEKDSGSEFDVGVVEGLVFPMFSDEGGGIGDGACLSAGLLGPGASNRVLSILSIARCGANQYRQTCA